MTIKVELDYEDKIRGYPANFKIKSDLLLDDIVNTDKLKAKSEQLSEKQPTTNDKFDNLMSKINTKYTNKVNTLEQKFEKKEILNDIEQDQEPDPNVEEIDESDIVFDNDKIKEKNEYTKLEEDRTNEKISEYEKVYEYDNLFEHEKENDEQEDLYQQPDDNQFDFESMRLNEREQCIADIVNATRWHPNLAVDFDEELTSTSTLMKIKNKINREILIDKSFATYSSTLCSIFTFIESYAKHIPYLNLDLSGFADYQMKNIGNYEPIVKEIADKYYISMFNSFPPEIRLMLLITWNVFIFHTTKGLIK